MTSAPSELADLLAECSVRGIRLGLAGESGLTVDAPQAALTPDLLARLKTHKAELLATLRPPSPPSENLAKPMTAVCRCGSTTWRDVLIHGGQSVRRDCDRCRRFLDFPVWYGKRTLQKAM